MRRLINFELRSSAAWWEIRSWSCPFPPFTRPMSPLNEHHCMLSHRKRKEKKNQATAMAWKSREG